MVRRAAALSVVCSFLAEGRKREEDSDMVGTALWYLKQIKLRSLQPRSPLWEELQKHLLTYPRLCLELHLPFWEIPVRSGI